MRVLFIIYDNDSFIHIFPMGIAYLTAVLEQNGIEVDIYNQDLHHWPDAHLTEHLDKNRYDVVALGFIAGYYQYKKFIAISNAINQSENRPYYILGGHGPSPEPEFFLKKGQADAVVIGEGEDTILSLLDAIANHKPLSDVQGIAFRDGDTVRINIRRPLIEDINSLPFPAYHKFPIEYYRLSRDHRCTNSDFLMPVLSGRGCKFRCNFCYRMDKGLRPRSNASIIEEIRFLKKEYGITYVWFADELLMSSLTRMESLCEDFLKAKLNMKWSCNGRLNYAKSDILKLMKKSGCLFINYGIEAMDDLILRNMNKNLTTRQIIKGIEATLDADISPGFNIIFGNIGENHETLRKGVDFLLKYDDHAQFRTIRPVTPYPGCDLYYHAIKKGLLKDCEDFYENKHLNSDLPAVNFTEMTDDELCEALLEANTKLIRNYFEHKCLAFLRQTEKLYLEKNKNFRGYRQI